MELHKYVLMTGHNCVFYRKFINAFTYEMQCLIIYAVTYIALYTKDNFMKFFHYYKINYFESNIQNSIHLINNGIFCFIYYKSLLIYSQLY